MEDSWTARLIDERIESVEQWESGPCIIKLSRGFRIQIECLWRLIRAGRLTLTSEDDGQLFGRDLPVQVIPELAATLTGLAVTLVQVRPGTADLAIHAGTHLLEIIATSSGYEAWQIESVTGTLVVGQGGGNVVVLD